MRPTDADSIDFAVVFDQDVTGFDEPGDGRVTHTGTAHTSVTIAQISPSDYTVTVSGITGNGAFTLSVRTGACRDQAGNLNLASDPSPPVQILHILPAPSSVDPNWVLYE